MAYSLETCPTTGKEHYQGFAFAKTPMKLGGWKKLFKIAHIEPVFNKNEAYCSKEGKVIEFGDRPQQGQRNDMVTLRCKLDAGMKPLDIAYEDVNMLNIVGKMHRFSETYAQYIRYREKQNSYTGQPNYLTTPRFHSVGIFVRLPYYSQAFILVLSYRRVNFLVFIRLIRANGT